MPHSLAGLLLATITFWGSLSAEIDPQIRYDADRLIAAALEDSSAFQRLARLVDTFGPRLSGTQNLEDALDWLLVQMRADSLENVRAEPVMIPRWERGRESAVLLKPRRHILTMIGLGNSVGTSRWGLKAEALVVRDWDELQARAAEVTGKIVVYNAPFTVYSETGPYRWYGASEAARLGAVACLVRSITPLAMAEPHTGALFYQDDAPRIPAAAITIEDAELLQRLQDYGETLTIRLKMGARMLDDVPSRNLVAELTGSEFPDEIVVMGGHSDSWDVGQGAMDDAGGCVAAWEALRLMKVLGLRPKRTVRVVMWVNEENGLRGGRAYRDTHMAELENHILAIETDDGVFRPEGFGFTGPPEALAQLQEIATLLAPIGADSVSAGGGGADISPIIKIGVPGMGLKVDESRYFWYHHTNADTIDKLDPHELNLCVAALAVMAYSVANLPERLPRGEAPATGAD
ncbi:MAG: M28 family metallopeptidase [Candidatus Neomarinimicrobiota bacterium]